MAQAVTKQVSASELAIDDSAFSVLQNLTATIMNGAGWIILSALITLFNNSGATRTIYLRLRIDGAVVPESARTVQMITGTQQSTPVLALVKAGSGQHTYDIQAFASGAGVSVLHEQATFSVVEPGF